MSLLVGINSRRAIDLVDKLRGIFSMLCCALLFGDNVVLFLFLFFDFLYIFFMEKKKH